jgi:hypothetical protein
MLGGTLGSTRKQSAALCSGAAGLASGQPPWAGESADEADPGDSAPVLRWNRRATSNAMDHAT